MMRSVMSSGSSPYAKARASSRARNTRGEESMPGGGTPFASPCTPSPSRVSLAAQATVCVHLLPCCRHLACSRRGREGEGVQGGVSRQAHQLQPHDGPAELAVIQVATAVCVRFVEERARGFQACRAPARLRIQLHPGTKPTQLFASARARACVAAAVLVLERARQHVDRPVLSHHGLGPTVRGAAGP